MPHSIIASLAVAVIASLFASPAGAAGACEASEHRQFDFWLGDWEVRTPDGRLAGVNSMSSEHGGCGVLVWWIFYKSRSSGRQDYP